MMMSHIFTWALKAKLKETNLARALFIYLFIYSRGVMAFYLVCVSSHATLNDGEKYLRFVLFK